VIFRPIFSNVATLPANYSASSSRHNPDVDSCVSAISPIPQANERHVRARALDTGRPSATVDISKDPAARGGASYRIARDNLQGRVMEIPGNPRIIDCVNKSPRGSSHGGRKPEQ